MEPRINILAGWKFTSRWRDSRAKPTRRAECAFDTRARAFTLRIHKIGISFWSEHHLAARLAADKIQILGRRSMLASFTMGRISALGLGLIVLATPGFGQFESATVLGSVHDPSGGSVGDARVTLENTKTGVVSQSKTEQNGDYEFVN